MHFSALRLWFRRRWFWKARRLAAGAVLGGLALALVPLGPLDRLVFDLTSVLAACADDASPPVDITIVELGTDSKNQLGQPPDGPLDRKFYAQAVRRLKQEGVKVVVFDLLFPDPARDPSEDMDFAAALREHGRVVLPAEVREVKSGLQQILPPCPALAATGWGSAFVLPDPDFVVRKHAVNLEDAPALAARATKLLGREPPMDYATNNYQPPGRFLRWPLPGYFQRLDFTNLIQHTGPLGLSNRVVILGARPGPQQPGTSSDTFGSPWTRFGRGLVSGPTVHAVVLANYAGGGWINQSSLVERGLWGAVWALAAVLAAWWLGGRRSFLMWGVPLLFPFLGLCISTFFFVRFQVWLPWFAPAILVPLAVAVWLWRTPVPQPIDIFISYRREADGETAQLLYEKLNEKGIVTFYAPEKMPPGPFPEHLVRKIKHSRCIVFVVSPRTFAAHKTGTTGAPTQPSPAPDYVQVEIETARAAGKTFIPVLTKGFQFSTGPWPPELGPTSDWEMFTKVTYSGDGRINPAVEQIITHVRELV